MSGDASRLLFLDTTVVLHVCLADALGEHVDSSFQLRSRPARPLIGVTSVGDVLRFANHLGLSADDLQNTQRVLKSFVQVDLRDPVVRLYGKIAADLDSHQATLPAAKVWIVAACAAVSESARATLLTCDDDLRQFAPQYFDVEYVDRRDFLTRDAF